jgi:peptidoglycan hydrolase-like protein with peptidoglycan-binding domain
VTRLPAPSTTTRRALLSAFLGLVALVGVGLFVGGTVAARRVSDSGGAGRAITTTTAEPGPTTTVATTTTVPPTTSTPPTTTTTAPPPAAEDGKLEVGEAGPEVAALQVRLEELGYWLGASDGRYGQLTRQAVMAFQKAEGLGRDGVAGPATQAALAQAGRVVPREPSGSHVEVDLARQILIVVQDGSTRWVLNTSTGSGESYANPGGGTGVATTPTGSFTVQREIDGLREAPLGTLYRPKYFHGGIAIHGSGSIPAQPASHGCVRLTNAAMDLLWASGILPLGAPVLVY